MREILSSEKSGKSEEDEESGADYGMGEGENEGELDLEEDEHSSLNMKLQDINMREARDFSLGAGGCASRRRTQSHREMEESNIVQADEGEQIVPFKEHSATEAEVLRENRQFKQGKKKNPSQKSAKLMRMHKI